MLSAVDEPFDEVEEHQPEHSEERDEKHAPCPREVAPVPLPEERKDKQERGDE